MQRVLVTGATSGIGLATAVELARRGVEVVLHGRTLEKAALAADEVRRLVPGAQVRPVHAELAELASVRRLAGELATLDRLDAILHNAGLERWQRVLTVDGHECGLQVNHLAPFLLTRLLEPLLVRSAPARVVFVSSVVHRWGELHWDDWSAERWFAPEAVYYQSKLAAATTAQVFARRLGPTGVTVMLVPPGLTRTSFTREFQGLPALWSRTIGRWLFRTPEQVATELATVIADGAFAAAHGAYVDRLRIGAPSPKALRRDHQARLWNISSRMVGFEPDEPEPATSPNSRPSLRRWLASVTAGELAGFSLTALLALIGLVLFGRPTTIAGRAVALGVMTLAGLLEGACLGLGQARPLASWMPRLPVARFVGTTMAVAAAGWFIGMSLPLLMAVRGTLATDAVQAPPSTALIVLLAMGFGAGAGALFGLAQARVLRRVVRRTRPWIAGSALGWAAGLPFAYLAGGMGSPGMPWWQAAGLLIGAGGLMGLCVALGTYLGLRRLEPVDR